MTVNANWPLGVWQWDPAYGPTTATRRWRSLTGRVLSAGQGFTASMGRQYELGAQETPMCTVPLDNKDELLTPSNLASPYQQALYGFRSSGSQKAVTAAVSYTIPWTVVAGELLVLAITSTATVTVAPVTDKSGTPALLSHVASGGGGHLYVYTLAAQGGEMTISWTLSGALPSGWSLSEWTGGTTVNVSATNAATGGAYTSVNTGTTGTSTATDLVLGIAGLRGFAAASPPSSPSWDAATQFSGGSSVTSSATASQNVAVYVGWQLPSSAGTRTLTCSWTNAVTDTAAVIVTFTPVATPTVTDPATGSMAVVPFRPLRGWQVWPSTNTGNLLNSGNDPWAVYTDVPAGSFANTAGFGSGTGTWLAGTGVAIVNSTTRAHDGTHSMRVTWPTAASGAAGVSTLLPPVETGWQYTLSAWVWVPSGGSPPVALTWNGTTGTASATTNAWERISVTVTRPDAADDRLHLATAGASTAGQQVWVDSVQVELAASPSGYGTTGSTIYPLHDGYVERWPETWSHSGYRGWMTPTSIGGLGLLTAATLQDCVTEDMEQDAPYITFPLWDAAGTVHSAGRSRTTGVYGQLSMLQFGSTAPAPAFGTAGSPGPDSFTSVRFAPTDATNYWTLTTGFGASATSTGGGTSFELWFSASAYPSADACIGLALSGASSWEIWLTTAGHVMAREVESSGTSVQYTITDLSYSVDAGWHQVVVTESDPVAGTVTGSLYVDGRLAGTGTRSASAAFSSVAFWLGSLYYPAYGSPFSGRLARVAVYQTALSADRVWSHWLAGSVGFSGDTTGQRVARLLAWMPWVGPTDVDTGTSIVAAAAGLAGKTVADAVNECAATENGSMFTGPDGVAYFYGRDRWYLKSASTVTFGEAANAYQADIATSSDSTYLYNTVTVTPSSGVDQAAIDLPSMRAYLTRSGSVTTIHLSDADAALLAAHLVNVYKQPRPRLVALTLQPSTDPTLWPVALGLRFGDRVTFTRTTSAGVVVSFDGFVDRVEHTVGVGTWVTKLVVTPVLPYQPWIIGDATYGVVGQTTVCTY